MSDQRIFQCITQRNRGSLLCRICLVIAHSDIETALPAVRIHDDENRRIICGQCVENRCEFVCDRLTFPVDHFRDVVHTDIVDQVFFQGKKLSDRSYLHLCKSAEILLPKTFTNDIKAVLQRDFLHGDRGAFIFPVNPQLIHITFPLIPSLLP